LKSKTFYLWFAVIIQVLCAGAFVVSLALSVLGVQRSGTSWQMREALEIAASLGLILGAILGVRSVFRARRDQFQAEEALRSASGAFAKVVDEKFNRWGLTKAEHDVAWFMIKGFSTKETADLRGTSDGTIKAQCNAIYRKVGVTGRAQLLSFMVEDLLLDTDSGLGESQRLEGLR
jgi:DNA-binding CsgD family transcriptional regulator